jgi:Gluconate 2-dehydrogenase subunit 3
MQRRTVIKNFIYIAGGALLLPSCLQEQQGASIPLKNLRMNGDQEKMLAEVVGTIIPTTDTPGAKDLGVHQFAMIMMDDCHSKEDQEAFVKGLDEVDKLAKKKYNNSFIKSSVPQREELLTAIEKKQGSGEEQKFYKMVKNLTIQGYLNSKYVMTNINKYELVPGRFKGCVPVTQLNKA